MSVSMNTTVTTPSMLQRIKRRTYEIMEGAVPDKYSHFVEIFIALLVVANVIGIILESVPEIHEAFEREFHAFDVFSVAVFSVEFVLRVLVVQRKIYAQRRHSMARSQRVCIQLLRHY
jgi:voltage-gated potassium channel